MKRWSAIVIGALVAALTAFGCATQGPPGIGWATLLDGSAESMDANWIQAGVPTNWRSEDGVIVADKGGKGSGQLLTQASYKDFQIWAEFWAADNTNSGIFIRITDRKNIGSKTSYEVNIYDQRPDPSYGTGAIVNVAKVDPMPKAGGQWNTMLITANRDALIVVLNGVETVNVRNRQFREGPFSLQFGGEGTGPIKWRKVMVKPL